MFQEVKHGSVEAYKTFSRLYKRSGVGIGVIAKGEGAEQVKTLIESLVGASDSDTISAQRGLIMSLADMGEEFSTFVPRISDEAISEGARIGGKGGIDLATRSSATAQRGFLESILKRGMEDSGFFSRIQGAFSSTRMDSGIAGTSILADRLERNRYLIDKVTKIKPGVYKGVAAVAAISAGYYLGRRSQREGLYDEVMHQQPTEENIGPMGIADFNRLDQELAAQSSSRRDPLVTAGVVGNLDRNKISHTRMGSDKYNHLFGA